MRFTTVTINGRATRDPELKFTQSGKAVCNLGVANNKSIRQADGTWEDGDPCFYEVTVWGWYAERTAETVRKGVPVVVAGKLDFNQWENEAGEKRSKTFITADLVGLDIFAIEDYTLTSKKGDGGSKAKKPTPDTDPFLEDDDLDDVFS